MRGDRTELLGNLRRLFAFFTILVAALLVIQLPMAETSVRDRAVAAAASVGVIAWSIWLWRRRPPLILVDAALLSLLAMIAVGLGGVGWIYSLLYVSLYQRALEGERRRTFLTAGLLYVLWETLAVLVPGTRQSSVAGSVAMASGVAFSAWLLQKIRGLVERQERMVGRELLLTTASRRLLAGGTPDELARVVAAAGAELPQTGASLCQLWRRQGEELVLAATEGPDLGTGIDRVPLAMMPPELRAAYEEGRPYRLVGKLARDLQRAVAGDDPYETLLVAPTVVAGRTTGLVLVTCTGATDDDLLDVLGRFAVEVSLAEERAELLASLADREARFASVVRNSSDVILIVEPTGTVLFANEASRSSFGFEPADLIGRDVFDLLHPDERAEIQQQFLGPDGFVEHVRFDCRLRTVDGATRDVEVTSNLVRESGDPQFVINVRDVTARRRLETELSFRAFHDPVTGLANRSLFADRVAHAIALGERSGAAVAVALIDLDDFKSVNDSLGHDAGDRMLVTVAERLERSIRSSDTAARLGGDEFAVLLEGVADAGEARRLLDRLLVTLEEPVTLTGREVPVRASIGVAVSDGGTSPDEFLRDADAAMYVAKSRGKHRIELFQPEMHAVVLRRLELRSELDSALERGEFELHYQPLVDLRSGRTVSLEALLRWRHPTRGLVPPDEFIPIAEQSGVIVELGSWVLETACRTVAGLGHPEMGLSVNVSARQLQDVALPACVSAALASSGLPAHRLMVEVTETAILEDPVVAGVALAAVRDLGARVAVDDFGTGHSSLLHLQHLPIDVVKVDRIFVQGAGETPEGARLVRAIEQLAAVLELDVVAEGIETEEQATALRALGYGVGQGFLYARPMPAADVASWLAGATGAPVGSLAAGGGAAVGR